jgi:flagellar hook-basal body complex protein FliE
MDIAGISQVQATTGTGYVGGSTKITKTDGAGFGEELGSAVDNLQQLQAESKDLAIKAVTGELKDIHSAMIASTRAAVTLELVAAVRNKGVDAFNEIMRMQA